MKTAKRLGGSTELGTKCFSIKDIGPICRCMCPKRGHDGRVGLPGANRYVMAMLRDHLIIELLAISRVRRAGEGK